MDHDEDTTREDVDERRYASLDEALANHKIAVENHAFIRRFTTAIGIAAYYGRSGYIKAVRSGAGPDLNIAYGWSNGFVSEDEVVAVAGASTERWPSGRGTDLWGVTHPVHGHASSGGGQRKTTREYGFCSCGYELLPSGKCGWCDE